jgi:hypothetical protein
LWRLPLRLDQGQEGACVGFAWAHELAADPVRRPASLEVAQRIYNRARELDEWPGSDYAGTSVLAGAKAVCELGALPEYRWAFGIDDVLAAIAAHGPVVLGIPWLDTMLDPGPGGRLDVTGKPAGGHAILARGVIARGPEPLVVLRNSWGADWGNRGDGYLAAGELERLLDDGGEACVPVRRG